MVKILFDHNMPPVIARGLHIIVGKSGHSVCALRDKFDTDISDVDYFDLLDRDWVVVSKDLKNARKKAERAAIMKNRIVAFYLSPALQKMRIEQQAASILWHWNGIIEQRKLLENGLFQLPENKARFRAL